MSATSKQVEATALRSLEIQSRLLPLDEQMAECIDLLQLPDVALDDVQRSVAAVASEYAAPTEPTLICAPSDLREGFFYPSREIFVQGDGCSFTCLATALEFVAESEPTDKPIDARPIDFAAVTCEATPFPVMGFAQSAESESAYPLLLRAFSTLIDLARPGRLMELETQVFRGLLGAVPRFDLMLVLWDDDRDDDPRRPLCELSRDLAETLKGALAESGAFPPVLRDIVCLRMNPHRFDARLRYVWRV